MELGQPVVLAIAEQIGEACLSSTEPGRAGFTRRESGGM